MLERAEVVETDAVIVKQSSIRSVNILMQRLMMLGNKGKFIMPPSCWLMDPRCHGW